MKFIKFKYLYKYFACQMPTKSTTLTHFACTTLTYTSDF